MQIIYHPNAWRDFGEFREDVKKEFWSIFRAVALGKELRASVFKKLAGTGSLYEARVKMGRRTYRGLGGYVKKEFFVVLFIVKKSRKLKRHQLELAKKRFNQYDLVR